MISRAAAFFTLLLLASCQSASGFSPQSRAEIVLAQSKQASGGQAWDSPDGCEEEGVRGDGQMTYKTSFSLRRYGMRIESQRGTTAQAIGFNGVVSWRTDRSGITTVLEEEDAVKEAIVTDYLSNNGFFFPDRFPAKTRYVRTTSLADRQVDVLEIAPVGGRPLEVWFDRRTHFISRVIDRYGPQPVTIDATDYRQIDGLTIATTLKVQDADGNVLDVGHVTSFRCASIEATAFDPPTAREMSR